jgi:altronate dehydratase large subunit
VQRIAQQTGAIPITHDYGCVEFERELNRTRLGLVRAGQHPNVSGVLVVGLGCEQLLARDLAEAVSSSGKPAEWILIQEEGGTSATVEKGSVLVRRLKAAASTEKRISRPVSDLIVAVMCGGSDWTSAIAGNTSIGVVTDTLVANGGTVLMSRVEGFPGSEHILASHAVSAEAGYAILKLVDRVRAQFKEHYGQKIEDVNPTPGNKAGGITTLVEKSMGNIKKAGDASVQGVLALGDPIPHPGLWIVDSSPTGPDVFGLGIHAIQGAHIVLFSTGRGTPVGSAEMPVVKVTGNPATYRRMEDNTDFNAGEIIEGKAVRETGTALYRLLLEVADGRLTKSEVLGHFEFAIPRDLA